MLRKLLPRESIFFTLFNEQAGLIAEGIDHFARGLRAGDWTSDTSTRIKAVEAAAGMLSDWRNRERIFDLCIEINKLENKGDQLLRDALKGLFAEAPDALYALKAKDIYESLEDAIDRCEDLANIIETIVIKNA